MKYCKRTLSVIFASLVAAPSAGSAQSGRFTDPASIDLAVAEYTGAPIGVAGGAQVPVDRRLKLGVCGSSLAIKPYGRTQGSLQVSCLDAGGWRIFVPLVQHAQAEAAPNLITKGDRVSIAVQGRGFSVAQSGRALESGAAGDWIRVEPPGKGDVIRARIERAGRVVIPLD